MFRMGKAKAPTQPLACLLSNNGYSLVDLQGADTIRFCENHYFPEPLPSLFIQSMAEDIDRYRLVGFKCQVVLAPSLYQLILMDSPDVPENEIAKALRWQLKGFIDYPLNDTLVDAFVVPSQGARLRKKVFAAATLQSELMSKVDFLENSLLDVKNITIAELALANLLESQTTTDGPKLVISYDEELCKLHIYDKGDLYLCRNLSLSKTILQPNSPVSDEMLLEIQRSIDYCLMEVKLPEPTSILFTPSFYEATDLFAYLEQELNKEVKLMDINALFSSEPLSNEKMAKSFYAIGGALMLTNGSGEA